MNIRIVGNLDIRKNDSDRWFLLSRVKFSTDHGLVTVKRGFIYDGGSIPRSVWSAVGVPPMGSVGDFGFLAHDSLYAVHRDRSPVVTVEHDWSRKEADRLMHDLHLQQGMDHLQAEAIYRAVRLGASWSWMTEAERKASRPSYDVDFLSL